MGRSAKLQPYPTTRTRSSKTADGAMAERCGRSYACVLMVDRPYSIHVGRHLERGPKFGRVLSCEYKCEHRAVNRKLSQWFHAP